MEACRRMLGTEIPTLKAALELHCERLSFFPAMADCREDATGISAAFMMLMRWTASIARSLLQSADRPRDVM